MQRFQDKITFTDQMLQEASLETHQQPYSIEKHTHSGIELYEIVEGSGILTIGEKKIPVSKGSFLLLRPNIVPSFSIIFNGDSCFKYASFDSELFSQLDLEIINDYPMEILTTLSFCFRSYYLSTADTRISELFTSIISTAEQDSFCANAYINLNLTELLTYIIERTGKDISLKHKQSLEQNKYISYTLHYIQEHYASKIQIGDIAEHLNVPPRYLSKIFSKHMNITLLTYIHIFRINRAIELLTTTNHSLTDISNQVGFNDSQQFSKLFKSIVGHSPYEYRKLLKG